MVMFPAAAYSLSDVITHIPEDRKQISVNLLFQVYVFIRPHEAVKTFSTAKGFIVTNLDSNIFNCYN